MDERERRTDLRRRAIATLAMVAAGTAILPEQGEPARSAGGAAARVAPHAASATGLLLARAKAGSAVSDSVRLRAAALRRNK